MRGGLTACLATTILAGIDYAAWDRVLMRHVKRGQKDGVHLNLINYCGVKSDSDYSTFLASIASTDLDGISEDELYAVYTNAYNAHTVNAVLLEAHDLKMRGKCFKSIHAIPGIFKKKAHNVSGKLMSLDDIENLLRGVQDDSVTEDCRLHGSLVCAGISCPNLRRKAYRPSTVRRDMEDNVREWLAEPRKGSVLGADGKVTVSKIFDWYMKDFKKCNTSSSHFISAYAPSQVSNAIAASGFDDSLLNFFSYDWSLNGDVKALCGCFGETAGVPKQKKPRLGQVGSHESSLLGVDAHSFL